MTPRGMVIFECRPLKTGMLKRRLLHHRSRSKAPSRSTQIGTVRITVTGLVPTTNAPRHRLRSSGSRTTTVDLAFSAKGRWSAVVAGDNVRVLAWSYDDGIFVLAHKTSVGAFGLTDKCLARAVYGNARGIPDDVDGVCRHTVEVGERALDRSSIGVSHFNPSY
jgi:hypothetical protein